MVDKIKEFTATLKDRSKSVEDRRFALRFLIRRVEDMHMPMHVGDNHDRGGNDTQVRFFDRGTDMHSLWDSGIIDRVSTDEDYWLKELTVLPSSQSQDATTESQEASFPVARRRPSQERVRLASVANEAFLEDSSVRPRLRSNGVNLRPGWLSLGTGGIHGGSA